MMQELVIKVGVTPEQAAIMAQMEAMVLFMDEQEKLRMRLLVGGIGEYTWLFSEWVKLLAQMVEGESVDIKQISEAVSKMKRPAATAIQNIDELMILLGRAMFAQAGSNGETIQ